MDVRSIIIEGDYDDMGRDGTLGPSESLDSDEVRNDDGDIVVDAPLRWISPEDHLTLDKRQPPRSPNLATPRDRRRGPGVTAVRSVAAHTTAHRFTWWRARSSTKTTRTAVDHYPRSRSTWRDRSRQYFGVCTRPPAVPGDHRAKRPVPAAQRIQGRWAAPKPERVTLRHYEVPGGRSAVSAGAVRSQSNCRP